MGKRLLYLFALVFLAAALLQFFLGNPDPGIFAFPVNAVMLLALVGGLYVLHREKEKSPLVASLSSGQAAVVAILLTGMNALLMVFFPGLEWQKSWIFDACLLMLFTNLFLVLLRYKGANRIRFYLNHAGLFVFVAALAFGAADMRTMRAAVNVGETIDKAYTREGKAHSLGYALRLDSFEAEFYEGSNRVPADFRAVVVVDGERHTLRVNEPWHRSWKEDVYLSGYDTRAGRESEYCVLEFVIQPWKYIALTGLLLFVAGALMLVWGGKNRT